MGGSRMGLGLGFGSMKSEGRCLALDSKNACRFLLIAAVVLSCCALQVPSNVGRSPVPFPLVPTPGYFGADKRFAMWQLPAGNVEKVIVIFPGINDYPYSYWDNSRECPLCLGRPEKRVITHEILSRNWAILVINALEEWGWWPQDNPDVLSCKNVITQWKEMHGFQGLPTMGWGMSAGGWMASTLALTPGFFDVLCLMICAALDKTMEAFTPDYPPTMAAHMPRDALMRADIAVMRKKLESKGVIVEEAHWFPQPLTPHWFSDIIIGMSLNLSSSIVECIRSKGWLDESSYFRSDLFHSELPNRLKECGLEFRNDTVGAILNLAVSDEADVNYAHHIPISRCNDEIFGFFERITDNSVENRLSSS